MTLNGNTSGNVPESKETVTITGLGNEGQGVGQLSSGKKVFVPAVLPGEVCEVAVTTENSRYAEGTCINLLTPSPARILSYGNFVPGADIAHMSYEYALEYKEDKVLGCLLHIGKLPEETVYSAMKPIIPCEDPLNYRNHMQYRLVAGRLCLINNITMMAEVPGNSILEYQVFSALRDCLEKVFANAPTNLFEEVVMRGSLRTREVLVGFVSGNTDAHEVIIGNVQKYVSSTSLIHELEEACRTEGFRLAGVTLRISATAADKRTRGGTRMLLSGNDYYEEILLGHKFRVHMGSFFQVNIPQAEVLYKCASEFTRDAASLLDLYCGAGTIGLSVLSPGQKLTGLDTVADAIRGAKENAQLNGVPNASFILKPAEDIDFTSVSASMPAPLTVIVDPPRKGLADALIRKLLLFRPGKICYISCDPATLARDISQLAGSGSYALTSVQPVDMFPWTHHVEVVAHLTAV